MYLPYFNKFLYQVPYLHIDEKEWTYIKDTFERAHDLFKELFDE